VGNCESRADPHNDICGDSDQIREEHTKQRKAANNINEVDAFVDGDWMRTLTDRPPKSIQAPREGHPLPIPHSGR